MSKPEKPAKPKGERVWVAVVDGRVWSRYVAPWRWLVAADLSARVPDWKSDNITIRRATLTLDPLPRRKK